MHYKFIYHSLCITHLFIYLFIINMYLFITHLFIIQIYLLHLDINKDD